MRITPTDNIILMSDPTVAAIPVEECGEPLVNLAADSVLRVDDRERDPHGAYAYLRSGVPDRLHQAERLLPAGLRLLVGGGLPPPPLCNAPTSTRTWPISAPSTATGTPSTSP
ncbi:hypothetical protein [Streptomyces sp. FR-008]|uniref:hypothetical protein n=1 Tax=Streptomyces sp. FR-008 TaxID=206662 RepID=UPI000721F0EB|nr:hypothetical protein [Streptomyces sp. FR-008]ALM39674.1 dipeptidase [Streptomyces sp. FR-008]KAF0793168.1 hypothetical protein P405_27760 [Streptomyces sp. FR-008]